MSAGATRPDGTRRDCDVDIWAVPPAGTDATLLAVLSAMRGRPVRRTELVRGEKGKPALPGDPRVEFNVTHCRDLALVAVADVELGIDIELADRRLDTERLARRILGPAEVEAYAALDDAADGTEVRRRFMLRRWVRKEAVVKALGHGLTIPLREIDVGAQAGTATPLGRTRSASWHLVDLDVPGHVAALAALDAVPRPRIRGGGAGNSARKGAGAAASSVPNACDDP